MYNIYPNSLVAILQQTSSTPDPLTLSEVFRAVLSVLALVQII